ncbi:hypothetical protein U1Q18_048684, partial [Sarracenia purpurea var. burkii]
SNRPLDKDKDGKIVMYPDSQFQYPYVPMQWTARWGQAMVAVYRAVAHHAPPWPTVRRKRSNPAWHH